ncbi:hypothetical protein LF599_09910 [Pseudodesulfovibrio thermohalotolerans]|uniref:hypothetical protein n=1 Tax=Pseudodesulfovibrio thermohalotolerans TaxID=2880651 RepID=UPI0022BA1118|nr:hypothetical protein [Pseudodesulfovibrio thermohalotolerans]WFS60995.1 hypothetical protein LF599_09910 [Pseudodesulfovibrio thermohalotolerans]
MIDSNGKEHSISAIEAEVISLHTTNRAIDGMVNHLLLEFCSNEYGTEAHFKGIPEATLFNSRLTDFLTPDRSELCTKQESRLASTIRITQAPHFNNEGTVDGLTCACMVFKKWLEYEPTFDNVNLPSIDKVVNITMPRSFFIKNCGNILKHNDMSLNSVANNLRRLLARNGCTISAQDSYIVLDDFIEWFHNDIFIYHGCVIVQMLNDIRHAIKAYVTPEAASVTRYVYHDLLKEQIPRIIVPDEMEAEYARHCYYHLMQDTRQSAYVKQFKTPDHFTLRY